MKIVLGGDHAGFRYKSAVTEFLKNRGYETKDVGPFSEESCDYPEFAHKVAEEIEAAHYDLGILICGSGNGVAITANKHQGVRAGLAWNEEVATLVKAHNDANVLCIPARFVSLDLALAIVVSFLNTGFEGGRHQRRVDQIRCS